MLQNGLLVLLPVISKSTLDGTGSGSFVDSFSINIFLNFRIPILHVRVMGLEAAAFPIFKALQCSAVIFFAPKPYKLHSISAYKNTCEVLTYYWLALVVRLVDDGSSETTLHEKNVVCSGGGEVRPGKRH